MRRFPKTLATAAAEAGLRVIHYEQAPFYAEVLVPPKTAGVCLIGPNETMIAFLLGFDALAIDPAEREALQQSLFVQTNMGEIGQIAVMFPDWRLDE